MIQGKSKKKKRKENDSEGNIISQNVKKWPGTNHTKISGQNISQQKDD